MKFPLMFFLLLSATGVLRAQSMPLVDVMRTDSLSIDAEPSTLADREQVASADADLARVQQGRFVSDFGEYRVNGFRTLITVRGKNPYTLILEDYPPLGHPSVVERGFSLSPETELAGFNDQDGGNDILLRAASGTPSLLRILRASAVKTDPPPGMRVGGPAMLVKDTEAMQTLLIPAYTEQPSLRLLAVDDARNAPATKWMDDGKTLRVEWHNQIDVFTFDTDPNGRTRFVLERQRGKHRDEVIAFGMPYTPPARATGRQLAHWSFDRVKEGWVADMTGNRFHARMTGGVRRTPGVRGAGIDGVSCEGVPAGELVIPSPEGELPGQLSYGALQLPVKAFASIRDRMTLSFWYAMPPTIKGAYHPYMKLRQGVEDPYQFRADGLRIYSYDHWLTGHRITADALGNHRLFGMIGPEQPRDMWNHYALVVDGPEAQLYINGDLKIQETGTTTLDGVIHSTESAAMLHNTWARMDEIRLYDYPLSLEEIQQQFRADGLGLLSRLTFDREKPGRIQEGHIQDKDGTPYAVENVEIVNVGQAPLPVTSQTTHPPTGHVLRFAQDGGSITFPPAISQGKPIQAVTFSAWVRLPEGYKGRRHLLSSGNHGHVGMFIGFWGNHLWGGASLNRFKGSVLPAQWTHLVCSYDHNRIRTYINGEKVQDDDQAFPSGKGWGVGQFSLAYDAGMEIDDVQLFSFALSDAQAGQVYAGEDVLRPETSADDGPQEKRVVEVRFDAAP